MVSKKDNFSLKKLLTGADGDYDYLYFGAQDIAGVDKKMSRKNLSAKKAEKEGLSQYDQLYFWLQSLLR